MPGFNKRLLLYSILYSLLSLELMIPLIVQEQLGIHGHGELGVKGPIIYLFDGRSTSRHKQSFIHLAGALMEHFLEGIAPLRHWYINPNEKSTKRYYRQIQIIIRVKWEM